MKAPAHLLAIDIGNSRIHWGLFENGILVENGDFPSKENNRPDFHSFLDNLKMQGEQPSHIVACSVVPSLNAFLEVAAKKQGIPCEFLTSETAKSLKIFYPNPKEIGADRLANAMGGSLHCRPPFIVIDMGTAVTLDIVTRTNGYEGGIIAPGFALLSDYLPQHTALLPRIDINQPHIRTGIGKSTREAMEIGCVQGFIGMIRETTANAEDAVFQIDGQKPKFLVTGGTYRWFDDTWIGTLPNYPNLTLEGLLKWKCEDPQD